MDIEAGVPPRHDELDHFFHDLAFPQKHPQDFVLKDLFHGLRVQWRRYPERSTFVESAIGAEHMAMGVYPPRRVEVEEIAEGLYGYDCPGSCLLL